MLYKIIDITVSRLEFIVLQLEVESERINKESTTRSHSERVIFIHRLKKARKSFIFVRELVTPKIKLMRKMNKCPAFSHNFKIYIKQLYSRIKFLKRIMKTADDMLDNSE
jgi:hypothetical protein